MNSLDGLYVDADWLVVYRTGHGCAAVAQVEMDCLVAFYERFAALSIAELHVFGYAVFCFQSFLEQQVGGNALSAPRLVTEPQGLVAPLCGYLGECFVKIKAVDVAVYIYHVAEKGI